MYGLTTKQYKMPIHCDELPYQDRSWACEEGKLQGPEWDRRIRLRSGELRGIKQILCSWKLLLLIYPQILPPSISQVRFIFPVPCPTLKKLHLNVQLIQPPTGRRVGGMDSVIWRTLFSISSKRGRIGEAWDESNHKCFSVNGLLGPCFTSLVVYIHHEDHATVLSLGQILRWDVFQSA